MAAETFGFQRRHLEDGSSGAPGTRPKLVSGNNAGDRQGHAGPLQTSSRLPESKQTGRSEVSGMIKMYRLLLRVCGPRDSAC